MLKIQIQNDLKQAMIEKNTIKLNAIRALKTAIMRYETAKEAKEADDQVIIDLAIKEVKQRKDSIEQFEKGGRSDLIEKEKAEIKILEKYLPQQMPEEEIKNLVKQAIAQTNASSSQDLGKVMGVLMPKVKGKADGAIVNRIVREELNG